VGVKYVKTWRYEGLPDAHDVEYAESLGCKVVVHDTVKYTEFTGPDGNVYRFSNPGFYGLEFTTTTKEQEAALLLKYGDLLDQWGLDII
jgi:hypothetical protein